MCLNTVDKKVNRKHLKREGKYVICWKVVQKHWDKKGWRAQCQIVDFTSGWNVSWRKRRLYKSYVPHFHAYMSESAAKREARWYYGSKIVRCKTFLKYITATGTQAGRVLVTSKIWIPPYPARK